MTLAMATLSLGVVFVSILARRLACRNRELERQVSNQSIEAPPQERPTLQEDKEPVVHADVKDAEQLRKMAMRKVELLTADNPVRDRATQLLSIIDNEEFTQMLASPAASQLTRTDKLYLLLFVSGLTVEDIATIQSIEVYSVYTAKYRIRKKLGDEFII